MAIDYEIFEGKSLSSLFQDIYTNTEYNRKQLDVLTKELVQYIKDGDTAVQLVPMIKEYLEINVKNDDQLVKMAGIVQRLVSAESRGASEDEFGLSEEEKNQLINNLEESILDIQSESDKIHSKIESSSKEIQMAYRKKRRVDVDSTYDTGIPTFSKIGSMIKKIIAASQYDFYESEAFEVKEVTEALSLCSP